VHIKGTALSSAERYVREHFGAPEWGRVLEGLDPADRAAIANGILVSAWYPFALFMKIVRRVEALFGGQVPRLHRDMGRAAAEYGITGFYKVFFKVGSPQFIISRAAKVWRTYNTSGELSAPVSEKGHAVIELSAFAEPARELCDRLPGFFERTAELSGARNVRLVHTQCVNRGEPVCRFEAWWD
jgi:hypothetical protein